jgi:hypothetical protein
MELQRLFSQFFVRVVVILFIGFVGDKIDQTIIDLRCNVLLAARMPSHGK